MLSFQRPAYNAGPWRVSGSLGFGRVLITLTSTRGSLSPNHLYKRCGLGVCQAEGDPSENPGHWVSNELLWLHMPHALSHLIAGRIKHAPCGSAGRTFGSLVSLDLPPAFSSLCCLCLVSFGCSKSSPQVHYELSPMSHDHHSSRSDAAIFPYSSNQSKSAPQPSFTEADICCCHF